MSKQTVPLSQKYDVNLFLKQNPFKYLSYKVHNIKRDACLSLLANCKYPLLRVWLSTITVAMGIFKDYEVEKDELGSGGKTEILNSSKIIQEKSAKGYFKIKMITSDTVHLIPYLIWLALMRDTSPRIIHNL